MKTTLLKDSPVSYGTGDIYDIIADQGATFSRSITLKTSAKKPVNITGYSGRMHIRTKTAAPITIFMLTSENGGIHIGGLDGTITLYIDPESTAAADPGKYVYDLEIYNDEEVTRIVQGKFTIRAEVTK